MFQVRIHGRGGQGVVSAAEINSVMRFLGDEALKQGRKLSPPARTREKMPVHDFEVAEALEEGVPIKWLSTIVAPSSQQESQS